MNWWMSFHFGVTNWVTPRETYACITWYIISYYYYNESVTITWYIITYYYNESVTITCYIISYYYITSQLPLFTIFLFLLLLFLFITYLHPLLYEWRLLCGTVPLVAPCTVRHILLVSYAFWTRSVGDPNELFKTFLTLVEFTEVTKSF